ncbi:hypothetical protein [Nocardiopsis ansamitocini]|uniref:Uncharacterized protein n=1 Tax=Nocardiopsis ansamitocini TaxID=1670832 RepID=A0A9W6PAR2_9ACTN|nr:hypothetical protein [Nocardiopsis ansamitocini]GLU50139.1 hypothetical protein Nans01_44900 [Nocardiopsis ansamitocini]
MCELAWRMGHSSTRAALVYLHARDDRARELADALGERAEKELNQWRESRPDPSEEDGGDRPSGT